MPNMVDSNVKKALAFIALIYLKPPTNFGDFAVLTAWILCLVLIGRL